ncbi:MAG: UDP-2,3-diacylglucosamine diphosphatase [Mycobacterium leprae]
MANERIYFISDTHLGDGTGADRFLYPEQLLRLLTRIEAEPGAMLVLLGDFLELWAASLEAVLCHHLPIFDALLRIAATHPVAYVVGNHDCLPWYYYLGQALGNLTIMEQFTALRGKLVAIHGHQYDPFNQVVMGPDGQVKTPWTRKLVQAIGVLERIGGPATGDAVDDVGTALLSAASALDSRERAARTLHRLKEIAARESPGERAYPPGEARYEDAARSIMRSGARFVVMGHTHYPMELQCGRRTYVNTGSWVWDRYPPTYGLYSQGKLQLMDANTQEPYRPEPPT